jgi:hypothetical protein
VRVGRRAKRKEREDKNIKEPDAAGNTEGFKTPLGEHIENGKACNAEVRDQTSRPVQPRTRPLEALPAGAMCGASVESRWRTRRGRPTAARAEQGGCAGAAFA